MVQGLPRDETTITGVIPCGWLVVKSKGGTIYGATNDFSFRAVENPVSVHDLHATMLHLLCLDHERLTYRYAGRDFRLTDLQGKVIRSILA